MKNGGLFLFLMLTAWLWALPPQLSNVPGGVTIVPLGEFGKKAPEAWLNNKRVRIERLKSGEWAAVAGIPLSVKKGEALAITHINAEGAKVHTVFAVTPKEYPEQRIRIDADRYVFPSAEELERIGRENRRLRARLDAFEPEALSSLTLIRPVKGNVSGVFGMRRFFNNEPRAPHSGVDLAAKRHAQIKAAARGRVMMTGDFFFCGNFVLLDHGQGLNTLYCHMQKVSVKKGAVVKQGQVIGTVGSSGRATGPHLHWGVSLNGVWIDPFLLTPPVSSGGKTKTTKPRPTT